MTWTDDSWEIANDIEIAEVIADALDITLPQEIEQIRSMEANLTTIEKEDLRDRGLYKNEKEAAIICDDVLEDSEIDYEFDFYCEELKETIKN